MSLYAYDTYGYVGDATSNKGWSDFIRVLNNSGDPTLISLANNGYSDELDSLEISLNKLGYGDLSPEMEAVRLHFLKLIDDCSGVLIISDGIESSPSTEFEEDQEDYVTQVIEEGDYAHVAKALDELEARSVEALQEIIEKQRDAFIVKVKRGEIKADELDLPYQKDLDIAISDLMLAAWKQGSQDGVAEVGDYEEDGEEAAFEELHNYAKPKLKRKATKATIPVVVPKSAIQWLDQKGLQVSGILSSRLLDDAKNIIINSMKTGEPIPVTVDKIFDTWEKWLGKEAVIVDEQPLAPWRLRTMVRTVTTEAYNHGRLTEFLDPKMSKIIEGVQWSSVLDKRTTEFCRYMNRRVFRLTDPDLATFAPPAHWNCRSIIIPIVIGMDIEGGFITSAQKARARSLGDPKFFMDAGVFERYVEDDYEEEELEEEEHFSWDDSVHPRHPAGSSQGGEFAPKGGVATAGGQARWAKTEAELNKVAEKIPSFNKLENVQKGINSGINTSGFMTVDGKKWFVKEATNYREKENELAAWEAAKVLGWTDFIVPVKATKVGGEDYLVAKTLPKGKALVRTKSAEKVDFTSERTQRMFLFEYVIGAGDRHAGNYWVDSKGKPWTIDHGRSFLGYSTVHVSLYLRNDSSSIIQGVPSTRWNSLWVRRVEKEPKMIHENIPRKLVEHVVRNESSLLAVSRQTEGWDGRSIAGMEKRLAFLRLALKDQDGPTVSLPW